MKAMIPALWLLGQAFGLDVVHLKSGETAPGRVTGLNSRALEMTVILQSAGGRAEASRSIPLTEVEFVDFEITEQERAFLSERGALAEGAATLGKLEKWFALPNSRAGEVALKFASLLEQSGAPENLARAVALYDQVIRRDWSEPRREEARRRRLKTLVAQGRLEAASAEAQALLRQEPHAELAIEARHVLALVSAAKLKKLTEDHPRWREDEEVRPERERLFHETLDGFLYAHLFHGAHSEEAGCGLWAACELCQADERNDEAAAFANDIIAFYSDSSRAKEAQAYLGRTKNPVRRKDRIMFKPGQRS